MINSAAVRLPVDFHKGARYIPLIRAPIHIVHWMVIATHPYLYAIEPHATNVPAEKKLIKSDNPPINQGTDSPPAKNDFKLIPVLAKTSPIHNTNAEKTKMTMVSILGLIIN